MNQPISLVAVVVRNYDYAIIFYVEKLGFESVNNIYQAEQENRWFVVRSREDGHSSVLLAKASSLHQETYVDDQSGGRIFPFVQTDNFDRDYVAYLGIDAKIIRSLKLALYGIFAVFDNLYNNLRDLVQFG